MEKIVIIDKKDVESNKIIEVHGNEEGKKEYFLPSVYRNRSSNSSSKKSEKNKTDGNKSSGKGSSAKNTICESSFAKTMSDSNAADFMIALRSVLKLKGVLVFDYVSHLVSLNSHPYITVHGYVNREFEKDFTINAACIFQVFYGNMAQDFKVMFLRGEEIEKFHENVSCDSKYVIFYNGKDINGMKEAPNVIAWIWCEAASLKKFITKHEQREVEQIREEVKENKKAISDLEERMKSELKNEIGMLKDEIGEVRKEIREVEARVNAGVKAEIGTLKDEITKIVFEAMKRGIETDFSEKS